MSVEDIELGISQSRNTKLANYFYRLKWIESYGTGLQRIMESYVNAKVIPSWEIGPNAFVITLPKIELKHQETTKSNDMDLDLWMAQHESFTRKELEEFIGKSKSFIRVFINSQIALNRIEQIGHGPATKYRVIAKE
ncbi:ATP-binding protein [Sporosarcina limicola]|uniref:HTH transcriptional regulator n=1 Tax=Sporosarcina limicola TaxID=34101 RepID=A0A927MM78_9BACL|nr:ATP-binding protein [Sporosarcina limicola]MBE1556566.1 putative HTH transcriptional regulator [Sporosarcina limicola]